MKPGDKIYRVVKSYDKKWYFCVYEFVRLQFLKDRLDSAWVEVAPILTFYESKYDSHSTFALNNYKPDLLDEWVRSWDYLSNDEQLAMAVYRDKVQNENQSNNKTFSISKSGD